MKNLIVAALAIPALAACADDAAPIVRIGLYKNGLISALYPQLTIYFGF